MSRDLEWAATSGNAVINFSTGTRIAASGEGLVLARADNTLEWRNPDGSLRAARWLGPACDLLSSPD